MKKILSLLLAAMMLLALSPTIAEENAAASTQILTGPDGSFTLDVPADWFYLTEAIVTRGEAASVRSYMQLLGIQQLPAMEEFAEYNNYIQLAFSGDTDAWLAAFCTTAYETMEEFISQKERLDEDLYSMYIGSGYPAEGFTRMEVQSFGGLRWYCAGLAFPDATLTLMVTNDNGRQYWCAFANADAELVASVMESFTVITE